MGQTAQALIFGAIQQLGGHNLDIFNTLNNYIPQSVHFYTKQRQNVWTIFDKICHRDFSKSRLCAPQSQQSTSKSPPQIHEGCRAQTKQFAMISRISYELFSRYKSYLLVHALPEKTLENN